MKTLTVVTVTYNAEKTLEKTILSVIGQSAFSQIDYIIVDGASKDQTVSVAKRYESAINVIISEPDHGIFDAMNKGAQLARTPWIMFMNAGDLFYDEDTVASLHLDSQLADHIVYGDCMRVYANGNQEYRKAQPFFKMKNCIPGIGICHQSMYIPTEWMRAHPYLWQQYPHCADFEQVYAFWQEGRRLQYLDRPLCLYAYGEGFSSDVRNIRQVFEENASITHLKHTWFYYKQKLRLWLSSLK
ncbi:MAG: glycosyltransferase [Bacteroidales bacterium]|nr:glycosyltransferase [Bacteroidales bacterium]